MKKYFFYAIAFISSFNYSYANNSDTWLLWWASITSDDIRNWNIHTEHIPWIIKWLIDFWIWIAWTVAVIFIIIWAYQVLLWSLEQDKSKWKNTIFMAIMWFIIASLAWFIIRLIIDNFWG